MVLYVIRYYIKSFVKRTGKKVRGLFDICCLTVILAVAACEDFAHLKVRNGLIIFGWIAGLIFRILNFGIYGLLYWFIGGVVPVFLLIILFCFRMIGASDIKLVSVIGCFYGVVYGIKVFIAALFIGGILSVIRCIRFGYLRNRIGYFAEYIKNVIRTKTIDAYYIRERDGEDVAIPFGMAISIGFLVVESGLFI